MEPQADLLAELHDEIYKEQVTTGTRFVNYIIDIIVYYVLLVLAGLALATTFNFEDNLSIYMFNYFLYVCYYTLMEGATKGRTIGKLVTGSNVIKDDGTPITWKDALMRSLCRIVPFEPFSALGGYPWHDRWTKTKVVKNKDNYG